jgi:hypothetical protein
VAQCFDTFFGYQSQEGRQRLRVLCGTLLEKQKIMDDKSVNKASAFFEIKDLYEQAEELGLRMRVPAQQKLTSNEQGLGLRLSTGTQLEDEPGKEKKSCYPKSKAKVVKHTFVSLMQAIKEWKEEMILPSAQQTMLDYLKTLTKPRSMTVEAFTNCIKVMVRYINNIPFPGPDPPTVSQTKLKNIIFCAMPVTWQTNFLQVHNVSTLSVLQFQQFMSQERKFAKPQNGNFNNRRAENPRDLRLSWNLGQFFLGTIPWYRTPWRKKQLCRDLLSLE